MTDAPTTRETADHAELARLAAKLRETKYRWTMGYRDDVLLNPDGPKAADALETLLSEIAALRGERDGFCPDGAELPTWPDLAAYWKDRATQAERQRDELLSFVRKLDCECDPSFSTASCGRCVQLANQGADYADPR